MKFSAMLQRLHRSFENSAGTIVFGMEDGTVSIFGLIFGVNPVEQALWMLLADFFAAAVPILPFVVLPVAQARIVSAAVTLLLLIGLGIGRAQVAKRDPVRTIVETICIGIAAALAGVGISMLIDRLFA